MVAGFYQIRARVFPGLRLRTVIGLWLLAEIVAFSLCLSTFGFAGTVVLTGLSSVLGMILLRRAGLDAARGLRRAMAEPGRGGAVMDGTLATLGALLLVLPGFVSDLVGLALLAPSVRHKIAGQIGGPSVPGRRPAPRRAATDVIDLAPADWRVIEPESRR